MRKGKAQVEQDVRDALAGHLKEHIGGGVYMSDTRPRDSRSEDAVIVAGTPDAGQWQRGRVRILVYVPDIDNGGGRPVKDTARLQEIEEMADTLTDVLHASLPEYSFEPLTAPGQGWDGDSDAAEHFVSIHLQYVRRTY